MTVLRMARATTRTGSRNIQFIKKVPVDILSKVKGRSLTLRVGAEFHTITVGEKVTISTRTADAVEGALRWADLTKQVEDFFERARNAPAPLSHKNRLAFAGAMRAFVINHFDEDPLAASDWQLLAPVAERLLAGDLESRPFDKESGLSRDALPPHQAVLAFFKPTMDKVSVQSGIYPTDEDHAALLSFMIDAMNEATAINIRKAEGDYSPDDGAKKYPPLGPIAPTPRADAGRLTISALFELWANDHRRAGKSERTISDFSTKIEAFKSFLGHENAAQVLPSDVGRWQQHLANEENLSPTTINGKHLAAVRVVFGAGLRTGQLELNPARGINLPNAKSNSNRDKGYSTDEATRILRAARADPATLGGRHPRNKLAIRWGPWICAHTGCRIVEAMQLRKEDLVQHEDVLCLRITPIAGSVKSGSFRFVPVHPQLIELGIERLFHEAPDGPLFFAPKATKQEAHKAAENAGEKVRRWLKDDAALGVTDVAPIHGLRHRFKTVASDEGIEERLSRAIMGHSGGGVADGYGRNTMRSLKKAIERMPYYNVE